MSNAASRTGSLSAGVTLSAGAAELAGAVARLFEVTTPADRDRINHRLLLALILSVGTVARFWGLGSVGLHGDEETMAMAAMHILKDGVPVLPSGMLYPRGLTQLYLMAGCVQLFGQSEWALRLPSAVCGVALIWFAYLAGRRFLNPRWNLAFAAAIALLPEVIVYSQTARMYIFLLTSVAACMACLFAWERSDRIGWLIGAVVALAIGIELHALAVTCVLLFTLPGVLQGDWRKFAYGMAAAAVVMVFYLGIDAWVNAQYPVPPPEFAADLGPPQWERSRAPLAFAASFRIVLGLTALSSALLAIHVGREVAAHAAIGRAAAQRIISMTVTLLLLAGVVAQLLLFYHVAALLYVVSLVLARRHSSSRVLLPFGYFALASALLTLIHVTTLASRPGSIVKLLGSMVGEPSVWPYLRIADFSHVAAVLAAALLVWGLYRLALGQRVPDYWLLLVIGVWIPLFAIGLFAWNMPPRYTAASLLPLLLAAFAFVQEGSGRLQQKMAAQKTTRQASGAPWKRRQWLSSNALQTAAAALAGVLIVNPAAAARMITGGYDLYPDHKGAAEFMQSQNLAADDIVLAEDVLQQTYYLGSVDYWLISRKQARRFVELVDGHIRDFYTGTAVISTGGELDALLRSAANRRVFVIGSGENQEDHRRSMRGPQIDAALHSHQFVEIYTGRDGLTKVWRAVSQPRDTDSVVPATEPTVAPSDVPPGSPPDSLRESSRNSE